ncbi:MAG: choice-of-anchor D domain-containing protein, partial [Acidobacteria bacterium]|nr:choice-of-anchor D domain-containing protein [Acidobacteriota bacterium]
YLGGSNAETGAGIAVDSANSAYVTGFTNSPDFPVFGGAFQSNYGGGNTDAFVSKLDAGATALVYSSYLGGSNAEEGKGIAVDVNANAYVAGQTCSLDFPTARPLQPAEAGNCDAFVAKVLVGPDISLSHSTLTFPAQSVGSVSPPQTITVSSSGDAPLVISDITTTGDFSQTNACVGVTLAVGDTCTIDVVFSPTAPGTRTGTLTITDNTPTSPHVVNLSGTTSVPAVSLSSNSLSFGSVPVGATSQPQTVTLTNTGTATLNVASIAISSEFSETDSCGAIVATGVSCTISVTFTPTAGGTRSGTLTITDDAAGSPRVVSLTGDGSGFTLSATPASAVIAAGQSAIYTVSVIPTSGFNKEVTLSCAGAPREATCTASPTSVTPDGTNPATATVTVTSRKRTMFFPWSVPHDPPPANAWRWTPWFLALAMLAFLAATRSRRLKARLTLTMAMLALLIWTSCGGGGTTVGVPSGTPAGNFTLTFTGTSGGGSQQTTVDLTVE